MKIIGVSLLFVSFPTIVSSVGQSKEREKKAPTIAPVFMVQQPPWVEGFELEERLPHSPQIQSSSSSFWDERYSNNAEPIDGQESSNGQSSSNRQSRERSRVKGKALGSLVENPASARMVKSLSATAAAPLLENNASPPSNNNNDVIVQIDDEDDITATLSFRAELLVIGHNYRAFDRKLGPGKFNGFYEDEVLGSHSQAPSSPTTSNQENNGQSSSSSEKVDGSNLGNNVINVMKSIPAAFGSKGSLKETKGKMSTKNSTSLPFPDTMPLDVQVFKLAERIIKCPRVPPDVKAYILPRLATWYDDFFYLEVGDSEDGLGGTTMYIHGNHTRGYELLFYVVEAVLEQESLFVVTVGNNTRARMTTTATTRDSEISPENHKKVKLFIIWYQEYIRPTYPDFGDLLSSYSLYGKLVLGRSGSSLLFGQSHGKGYAGNPAASILKARGSSIGLNIHVNSLTEAEKVFLDVMMPLSSKFRKRWLQISLGAGKYDDLAQRILKEMHRLNVTLDSTDSWDLWNQITLSKSKKSTLPSIQEYISAGVLPNLSEKLSLVSKLSFVQVGAIVGGLVPSGLGTDGTATIASTLLSFLLLFMTTCTECFPGYMDVAAAVNDWRASWFEGFLIARVAKSLHRSSLCTRSLLSVLILIVVYIYGLVVSGGEKVVSTDNIFADPRLSSIIYLLPLFITSFIELLYAFFAYLLQVRDPLHLANVWEALKEEEYLIRRAMDKQDRKLRISTSAA